MCEVPIVLCMDAAHVKHMTPLVNSVRRHVPGAVFYLITDWPLELPEWVHKHWVCDLWLDSTPIRRITKHMWYRCFIDLAFPELEKCIYLDFDVLVLADIGVLLSGDDWVLKAAEYNGDGFNSGVLVFNFKQPKTKELLAQVRERICETVHDQQVLNHVFKGHVTWVDRSYNYMPFDLWTPKSEHPKIVHFCGSLKPWNYPQEFCLWWEYQRLGEND